MAKKQTDQQAQAVAVLDAVSRPMSTTEVFNHPMFRPVKTNVKACGISLASLAKTGKIKKTGVKPKLLWSALVPTKKGAKIRQEADMHLQFKIGPYVVQASVDSDGRLQLIADKE